MHDTTTSPAFLAAALREHMTVLALTSQAHLLVPKPGMDDATRIRIVTRLSAALRAASLALYRLEQAKAGDVQIAAPAGDTSNRDVQMPKSAANPVARTVQFPAPRRRGAPRGNANRFVHGGRSAATIAARRESMALKQQTKALCAAVAGLHAAPPAPRPLTQPKRLPPVSGRVAAEQRQ